MRGRFCGVLPTYSLLENSLFHVRIFAILSCIIAFLVRVTVDICLGGVLAGSDHCLLS